MIQLRGEVGVHQLEEEVPEWPDLGTAGHVYARRTQRSRQREVSAGEGEDGQRESFLVTEGGRGGVSQVVLCSLTCTRGVFLHSTFFIKWTHTNSPLLSEGWRKICTDITIFGEESEQVSEGPLSHVDAVRPVPHRTRTPAQNEQQFPRLSLYRV